MTSSTPAGTTLAIIAADLVTDGAPPPGAVAYIDGNTNAPLVFGAANTVTVPGITPGLHTVEVRANGGYFPDQDPEQAGEVGNPGNPLFGNPKQIDVIAGQWNFAPFAFVPLIQANGQVEDTLTQTWIEGARVAFHAVSGVLSGVVVTQYPLNAVWSEPFITDLEGRFPTNVFLPAVQWDMHVIREGYSTIIVSNVFGGLGPGQAQGLGTLSSTPDDANTNNIADWWEAQHFGGDANGHNDADSDGHDNRTEYFLGTDPTNHASALAAELVRNGTNGLCMRWPVIPRRVYWLEGARVLGTNHWRTVYGPVTSGTDLVELPQSQFEQDNTSRFYRVGVQFP